MISNQNLRLSFQNLKDCKDYFPRLGTFLRICSKGWNRNPRRREIHETIMFFGYGDDWIDPDGNGI